MIILFDEAEKSFTSLGLGILRDAIECTVKESLNDSFEFEMTYPITGSNYSKIRIGRIICAKPNPYDDCQPFRIYSISKPLKGIVTIIGYHVSYDMNGIPVKAIDATGLNDALNKIQNGTYISSDFNLKTNISTAKTFKTTAPYNMRAILMGDDEESLLGVYNGEVKFDKFDVTIYSKRGKNRGAQVCYGQNMTDLTHETNVDRLYNKVFPYYHKETTSTETVTEDKFTQVYIVGSKAFQDGWLSYSKDGEAYHPLDATPVQIVTEGDYYEKVYAWNTTRQKYEEKIYNETVTLVEGVVSPTWIVIDWSKFPIVTCRANAKGYYKPSTEDDWGDIKGVGDVIFSGNVLSSGLTGMASNMLIYYSEVIPASSTSESKEVSEVVDVILDEPIINIETSDAKAMKFDRVLSLDLTSEFDEEPSKDKLKTKAEEYISKNKVGTVNHNTTVSFIDLSTTEKDKYKNFDHIELGDTVRVIYKDLGVDVELRAITTNYNVITGRYNSVELGVKDDTLSSQSIQNGDSISSLTNDVGYTDITTVNKLIADTVTAEFIQAVNAKLTKAQIEELSVAKISCSGIIEASQFTLDELVAKLLVADNAKISETLEAGQIKVSGDITVNSGEITIEGSNGTTFRVDRDGNVTANSVEITGGTLDINDGVFEVQNDGTVTCQAIQITGGEFNINDGTFEVDNDGKVTCKSINITGGSFNINNKFSVDEEGNMTATSGNIAGFTIQNGSLYYKISSFDDTTTDNGVYIGTDGIRLGKNFTVDNTGQVTATGLKINLTPEQKAELKGEPGDPGINGTSEGYLYHLDSSSAYSTKPTGIDDSDWSSSILFPTSEKPYCYSCQYTKTVIDSTASPITYSYEFATPTQHSTLNGMLTLLADDSVNIITKIDDKYVVNADKLKGTVSSAVEIAGFTIDDTSLQNGNSGETDYIGISSKGLYRNSQTDDSDVYSFDTVSGFTYSFERYSAYDTTNYNCYRSTNYNINSSYAVTRITFLKSAKNVKIGIRSYAEGYLDYTIISKLNASYVPTYYYSTSAQANTRGNQKSGTSESDYIFVTYDSVSEGDYVYVVYVKDISQHVNDDRGYVLFPKVVMFSSTSVILAGTNFRVDNDGYLKTTYGKIGNLSINKSGSVAFNENEMILGSYSTDTRLPSYASFFSSVRINTFISALKADSQNNEHWITLTSDGLESYSSTASTSYARNGQIPLTKLKNIIVSQTTPSVNNGTNRYIKMYAFKTAVTESDTWLKFSLASIGFKRILSVVATCCAISSDETFSTTRDVCMTYFTSNSEGNCDIYIANNGGSTDRAISVIVVGEGAD